MSASQGARRGGGVVERVGQVMNRLAARFVPSPFILAALLTGLTLLVSLSAGRSLEGKGLGDRLSMVLVDGWFAGLYGAGGLTFAFQMVLVLVTGYAFALSPPVQRLIDGLAAVPRTAAQASALVALVACVSGYIHWGLGAVAGALLAREIGRAWHEQGRALHYPLLGAAAYSGLLVWHGGLSGSAPLKVAEDKHFLLDVVGVIPADQTLFSALNLCVTGSLVLVVVASYALLTPSDPESMTPFRGLARVGDGPGREGEGDAARGASDQAQDASSRQHPAIAFLERSPFIPLLLGGLGLAAVGHEFWAKGFKGLNLSTVNLFFFSAGLMLHASPRAYLEAASEGARGAVGIVLQFPLYFGILGMLKASGLIVQLSDLFVAISSTTTFPIFTFLSAGLVNLFVPSGGGQWAVQGPVLMPAAKALGVEPAKAIMALAYGDAWTNMLQPFWALPLLGIMGLKARDIIGYTTLIFVVSAPVIMFWLLMF